MKKLKVLTVVGTRPEIIRLSRVMAALDRHMDHVIVHTGQNYDYELNEHDQVVDRRCMRRCLRDYQSIKEFLDEEMAEKRLYV